MFADFRKFLSGASIQPRTDPSEFENFGKMLAKCCEILQKSCEFFAKFLRFFSIFCALHHRLDLVLGRPQPSLVLSGASIQPRTDPSKFENFGKMLANCWPNVGRREWEPPTGALRQQPTRNPPDQSPAWSVPNRPQPTRPEPSVVGSEPTTTHPTRTQRARFSLKNCWFWSGGLWSVPNRPRWALVGWAVVGSEPTTTHPTRTSRF